MLPKYILCVIAFCMAVSSLPAQNQAQVNPNKIPELPAAKPDDILCKCITTFQLKKGDTYFLKIDGKFHQVILMGESISQPFPVRGSSTFTLYQEVADEAGNITYQPAVEQALTGSGKSHLVILKRKDDKSPIQSSSHNLSTSNLPANAIYFLNESTALLGVQINTTKTTVKPFSKYTYNFQNTTRDSYTSAKVLMRYNGENKIMSSKRLRLVPGRRFILVAFPSRARAGLGSTPLRMLSLQDMP